MPVSLERLIAEVEPNVITEQLTRECIQVGLVAPTCGARPWYAQGLGPYALSAACAEPGYLCMCMPFWSSHMLQASCVNQPKQQPWATAHAVSMLKAGVCARPPA